MPKKLRAATRLSIPWLGSGPSKLGVAAMSSAIEAFCSTLFGFGMILDRDTNGFCPTALSVKNRDSCRSRRKKNRGVSEEGGVRQCAAFPKAFWMKHPHKSSMSVGFPTKSASSNGGKICKPWKISGSKTKPSWGFSGFRRYRFSHRSTRRRLQLDFLGHRCDSADTATRWLHYGWSYLVKQAKFSNGDHYALWLHYDPMRYWLRPGQIETLKKKVYHPSNWHAFHGVKKNADFQGETGHVAGKVYCSTALVGTKYYCWWNSISKL